MLKDIELAGRTCYKSEDKITEDSCIEFVRRMIKSGHHAMIEFAVPPPVKVITDRGVTHEIVRHRLFSFAQESTRYCNYKSGVRFILPTWFYEVYEIYSSQKYPLDFPNDAHDFPRWNEYLCWRDFMGDCEQCYLDLLKQGQSPQEARSVLTNSLKTEINIRGNVHEWRHFFKLRNSKAAHPQMRALAFDMFEGFKKDIPVIFDDLG